MLKENVCLFETNDKEWQLFKEVLACLMKPECLEETQGDQAGQLGIPIKERGCILWILL